MEKNFWLKKENKNHNYTIQKLIFICYNLFNNKSKEKMKNNSKYQKSNNVSQNNWFNFKKNSIIDSKTINIANGKIQADLVIKNCKVVNPITRTIKLQDIAILNKKIIGIGKYKGKTEIDANGLFAVAGLIDSHVHIESSMCTPQNFASLVIPKGTTTVIADSHEIANVKGIKGIHFMIKDSRKVPLKTHFMIPSCVPATFFEDSGAKITPANIKKLLKKKEVLGLGEMMNFPGVVKCDSSVLEKICLTQKAKKIADGHAPALSDYELNAYCAAGIKTDHECSTVSEVQERLEKGMYVLLRQGSAAKNVVDLLPAITSSNSRRTAFCSDDKHPQDTINSGHINENLRLAVKNGIDVFDAISMATVNAAECYELKDFGLIAPGYFADIVLFEDLEIFEAKKVFINGKLVAENGKPLFKVSTEIDKPMTDSVKIKTFKKEDLKLPLKSENVKVISLKPHSLVTGISIKKVNITDGFFDSAKNSDIQKLIVMERHKKTGKIGRALIEGYGIKGGAIATTIAHDSHNIIATGDSDNDIFIAINELAKIGGGIVVVKNGKVAGKLSLAIAGLMSYKSAQETAAELNSLLKTAWEELNISTEIEPFMTLSFLSLPVIPELKLTTRGLFDVKQFEFTQLEAD